MKPFILDSFAQNLKPKNMIKTYLLLPCFCMIAYLGIGQNFELDHISSYSTGLFDEAAAEIVAYDPLTQRVFFTNAESNSVGVLDASDINNPSLIVNIPQDLS